MDLMLSINATVYTKPSGNKEHARRRDKDIFGV